mmetsp:Transcript_72143/g.139401  ORF Transcript_72143/g.139401 Transcript_72143/m.139401 type:complete len:202 (-) Transcript_72143:847-1452(-)
MLSVLLQRLYQVACGMQMLLGERYIVLGTPMASVLRKFLTAMQLSSRCLVGRGRRRHYDGSAFHLPICLRSCMWRLTTTHQKESGYGPLALASPSRTRIQSLPATTMAAVHHLDRMMPLLGHPLSQLVIALTLCGSSWNRAKFLSRQVLYIVPMRTFHRKRMDLSAVSASRTPMVATKRFQNVYLLVIFCYTRAISHSVDV